MKRPFQLLADANTVTAELVYLEELLLWEWPSLARTSDHTSLGNVSGTDAVDVSLVFGKSKAMRVVWENIEKAKWLIIGTPRLILEGMADFIPKVQKLHDDLPKVIRENNHELLRDKLKRWLERIRTYHEQLEEYAEDRTNPEARQWGSVQGNRSSLPLGEPLLNISMGELVGARDKAEAPFPISLYKPSENSANPGEECTFKFPAESREAARDMAPYALAASMTDTPDPTSRPVTSNQALAHSPQSREQARAAARVARLDYNERYTTRSLEHKIASIREFVPSPATDGIATAKVPLEGWSVAVSLREAAKLDPSACSVYFTYYDGKDLSTGEHSINGNSADIASLISAELAKSKMDWVSLATSHQMIREGLASLLFDVLSVDGNSTVKTLDQIIHELSVGPSDKDNSSC